MTQNTVTLPVAIVGFVNAVLGLLLAFGVNVTEAQTAAIGIVVNAALILGGLLWDYRQKLRAAPAVAVKPRAGK